MTGSFSGKSAQSGMSLTVFAPQGVPIVMLAPNLNGFDRNTAADVEGHFLIEMKIESVLRAGQRGRRQLSENGLH